LKVECIDLYSDSESLEKISAACQPRSFSLFEDWLVQAKNYPLEKLNGTIKIPTELNGEKLFFDGASVPIPWLFSAVTFGLARPMGVMLASSVIHDFAYQHGYIFIKKDTSESFEKVPFERFEADDLFKDVMIDVTDMPKISYLGWMVLRLGWFYIDYAGKKRGPRKPYIEVLPLVAGLLSSISLLLLSPKWLIGLIIFAYLIFWFRISSLYSPRRR
jgi:hypothetical protein